MASAPSALLALLRPAIDYALPPRCPGCGIIVPGPAGFCLDCWTALALADIAEGGAPRPVGRVVAATRYGEVSRAVVLAFKHGNRPRLAEVLSGLMVAAAAPLALTSEDRLVPVPLHRTRLWRRGYNQAALLARGVSRRTGAPVLLDALCRVRATSPQHHGRESRRREVANAFTAPHDRRAAFAGRRVVLIDDVLTTGSTAAECARVLIGAGAARVDVLCWARVIHDH